MYPCPECNRQFSTEYKLHSHAGRLHGVASFECKQCAATFRTPVMLKSHSIIHTDDRPFACGADDNCAQRFRLLKELVSHQKNAHTIDLHTISLAKCKLCGARCDNINEHLRTCHPANHLLECDICGGKFLKRNHIAFHMKSHINLRPYKCPHCTKTFNFKNKLNRHVRTHSAERPYQCEACGQSFKHAQVLQGHMRRHTGEKPFKCALCSRAYSTTKSLRLHTRTHTGEKPYKCPICERAFSDGSAIKMHMFKKHTNEKQRNETKPFACHVCGNRTKYAHNLKSHYRKFHQILNITCQMICENAKRIAAGERIENESNKVTTDVNEVLATIIEETEPSLATGICLNPQISTSSQVDSNVKSLDRVKCEDVDDVIHTKKTISTEVFAQQIEFVTIKEEEELDMTPHKTEEINVDMKTERDNNKSRSLSPSVNDFPLLNDNGESSSSEGDRSVAVKSTFQKVRNIKRGYCDLCAKTFVNIDRHRLVRHAGKFRGPPYVCDHAGCEKTFDKPSYFRRHLAYHSKLANIICDKCGSTFKFQFELQRHSHLHSDHRPFECDICGKSFKDFVTMKRHIQLHSGTKQFPCSYDGCDKIYKSNFRRVSHVRSKHTGEKPYSCSYCDHRFPDSSSLTQHLRMHTGVLPYKCHLCGKGHSQSGNLKRHLRLMHKTIV